MGESREHSGQGISEGFLSSLDHEDMLALKKNI